MRKVLFAGVLIFSQLFAHKIVLFNGKVIKSNRIELKDGMYILDDTVVSKLDVKKVIFAGGASAYLPVKYKLENVDSILEKAKKARRLYPDASGIVLLDKGFYEMEPDSTRYNRYHFQGLILKDEARDWANVRVYIEEDMMKAHVLAARCIKPDGRVIYLNPKDIKVTKPKSGLEFFGKGKVMSFTIPGVEVGDIVEYVYEYNVFNPWDKHVFSDRWFFGGKKPVIHSEVTFKLPASSYFKYLIRNTSPKNVRYTEKQAGPYKLYKFSMDNVDPVVDEPKMPPLMDVIPMVAITNQKSWDYLYTWYANFQKKRIVITPEIQALADSIVKGAISFDDSIARIYYWVQQNIRYISIKGGASSGVSGHPASETLKKGYGDCTDKSILFSTLLRAIGVMGYPVYIETNDQGTFLKDVPSFQGNHAITEILTRDGRDFYLDATGSTSRYPYFWSADHGVWALNAQLRKISFIKVPPPEDNWRKYTYKLTIKPDGTIRVEFLGQYTGDFEAGVRWYWQHVKEKERTNRMEQMIQMTAPGAKLVSYELGPLYDLSKQFYLKITFDIPEYLKNIGDLHLLELPDLKNRYRFPEINVKNRHYNIVYRTSYKVSHDFYVTFSGYKLKYLPDSLNIQDKHFSYQSYFKKIGPDRFEYHDVLRRWDRIIPKSDYESYKKHILMLLRHLRKPVILEGGK